MDVSFPVSSCFFLLALLLFCGHISPFFISYSNYLINLTATQAISPRAAAHSSIRSQEPIGNSSNLTVSQQFTRPNTAIHYSRCTPHYIPMPARPIDLIGWKKHTEIFWDQRVTSVILGICRFGARIGYEGPSNSIGICPNLSTAEEDKEIVTANIVSELADNRLKC